MTATKTEAGSQEVQGPEPLHEGSCQHELEQFCDRLDMVIRDVIGEAFIATRRHYGEGWADSKEWSQAVEACRLLDRASDLLSAD